VKGRWQNRKQAVFLLLIAVYALLPWIVVGGHPSVLIDIPRRQAFLFGKTFTNQDFYLLFFLISGIGFGLFVLTALWDGSGADSLVLRRYSSKGSSGESNDGAKDHGGADPAESGNDVGG